MASSTGAIALPALTALVGLVDYFCGGNDDVDVDDDVDVINDY